jgi:hypothetical protein
MSNYQTILNEYQTKQEKYFSESNTVMAAKTKKGCLDIQATFSKILSLLSDSNQRPRDYKSRALAN